MADKTCIMILEILRSRRGCSIYDLAPAFPESHRATDAYGPYVGFLYSPLERLLKWGLVEAYHEEALVQPTQFDQNPRLWSAARFYISPLAIALEEELGYRIPRHSRVFREPDESRDWPKLFMLMPFAPDLKPVFNDHVKVVAESLGLTSARADDFFSTESIVQDIWSAMHFAEVIVADCTSRNPNVFYEIGIGHTLGRETILITQSIDDIPFDLRHLRVIIYKFTPRGMRDFEEELHRTIKAHLERKARIRERKRQNEENKE